MKIFHLLIAAALAAPIFPVAAQHADHNHTMNMAATSTTPAKSELAEGEIRRIDKTKGTAVIKHGELKSVGMGAMTMGFKFKDPKMAEGLKEGDKIKFAVVLEGGDLVITQVVKQ